jgi:hypothetical protein
MHLEPGLILDSALLAMNPTRLSSPHLHSGSNFFLLTKILPNNFLRPTHWRNVTFVLENHLQVEAGDEIEGTFLIFRNKQWLRHFEVTISFKKKGMDTSITQTLPLWR